MYHREALVFFTAGGMGCVHCRILLLQDVQQTASTESCYLCPCPETMAFFGNVKGVWRART